MMSKLRSALSRLCSFRGESFVPEFGDNEISDLALGQSSWSGVSSKFARADHKHGMPATPSPVFDQLYYDTFFDYDLMSRLNEGSSGGRCFWIFYYTSATGATQPLDDDPPVWGGWGAARNAVTTTSFGAFAANWNSSGTPSGGQTDDGAHEVRRIRRMDLSVRFGGSGASRNLSGKLRDCTLFVGMLRTGTHGDLTDIQDGLFFRNVCDSTGPGNWKAVACASGVETEVGTGVDIPHELISGPSTYNTPYQRFRIDLSDDGVATYYINNVLKATIDTNIPALGNKVCGYGGFCDVVADPSTEPFLVSFDGIRIVGRRDL